MCSPRSNTAGARSASVFAFSEWQLNDLTLVKGKEVDIVV
eukprot:CAMPEP_0174288974 /NCGR_PEP_ID=MMETSP0809-20121228/23103_1 /TAXON_ID=73025 ORGANISM="Eutreptiella gymnastica-like, Strain CCMP1594" /NCGR_SAMPLE_ID=MMETSP0809 /ASSEMBLY_ACC=CAM_ASM_000658 /LENGTH=39 /DNA_ID= /DNA_START= /DNA_END= /DNA_ORIENTATION=